MTTEARVTILYRKNLAMTPGKLASQAAHAALGLRDFMVFSSNLPVVVLGVTDVKFDAAITKHRGFGHLVRDAGRTEVEHGTETCFAFFDVALGPVADAAVGRAQ